MNEKTLETVLLRFVSPTVNEALEVTSKALHWTEAPYLGEGCRTGYDPYRPDWSLISDNRLGDQAMNINMLPGDTKVHHKWHPELKESDLTV